MLDKKVPAPTAARRRMKRQPCFHQGEVVRVTFIMTLLLLNFIFVVMGIVRWNKYCCYNCGCQRSLHYYFRCRNQARPEVGTRTDDIILYRTAVIHITNTNATWVCIRCGLVFCIAAVPSDFALFAIRTADIQVV